MTDKWIEYFMRIAYEVSKLSRDPKTRIGTVLVKDKNIISTGFNGFARGVSDHYSRYSDRLLKYDFICHSESNSITNCARNGISSFNSICLTLGVPCAECTKVLIQGGISKIIIHKQWPEMNHVKKWIDSVKISKIMLKEANIPIEIFDKKLGLVGFLDGKEIQV